MKRPRPSDGPIDLLSSDESSDSEIGARNGCDDNQEAKDFTIDQPSKRIASEGMHIVVAWDLIFVI